MMSVISSQVQYSCVLKGILETFEFIVRYADFKVWTQVSLKFNTP